MEAIVVVAIIMACMKVIVCVPINNGFSVKFNTISRDESVSKTLGVVVADTTLTSLTSPAPSTKELEEIYPRTLSPRRPNQIAKMVFPSKMADYGGFPPVQGPLNFINLPIVAQPYTEYKVLVATAPPHMRLNDVQSEPIVIYIVFTEDHMNDTGELKMPTIYFVNKKNSEIDFEKKEKADPIFIVDSNRTVTGIKSNGMAKFIKFRSKFLDRVYYETTMTTNSSKDEI